MVNQKNKVKTTEEDLWSRVDIEKLEKKILLYEDKERKGIAKYFTVEESMALSEKSRLRGISYSKI